MRSNIIMLCKTAKLYFESMAAHADWVTHYFFMCTQRNKLNSLPSSVSYCHAGYGTVNDSIYSGFPNHHAALV